MDRFLTLSYYFSPLPSANYQHSKLTLAVGLLLVVAGFLIAYTRKKRAGNAVLKKMLRPYPTMLKTYGVLVLILLLVRETGIPYLSMRFLWVVIALFFLYHLLKFAFTFKKSYQNRLHQARRREKMNRYLPKKKK